MLYYYWTRHGIRPSVIYTMPPGERMLVRAFYEYEREDVNELIKDRGKDVFPVIDIMQARR